MRAHKKGIETGNAVDGNAFEGGQGSSRGRNLLTSEK